MFPCSNNFRLKRTFREWHLAAVLRGRWYRLGSLIVASLFVTGCGPTVHTRSIPISEAPILAADPPGPSSPPASGSPAHDEGHRENGNVAPPPQQAASQTNKTSVRLERISSTRPFVYRVLDGNQDNEPLFALKLLSCGAINKHSPLGNARILFSGMSNVRVGVGAGIPFGNTQYPVNEASASVDGNPVYIRSLSIVSGECLTDLIVWSTNPENITERAYPALQTMIVE